MSQLPRRNTLHRRDTIPESAPSEPPTEAAGDSQSESDCRGGSILQTVGRGQQARAQARRRAGRRLRLPLTPPTEPEAFAARPPRAAARPAPGRRRAFSNAHCGRPRHWPRAQSESGKGQNLSNRNPDRTNLRDPHACHWYLVQVEVWSARPYLIILVTFITGMYAPSRGGQVSQQP